MTYVSTVISGNDGYDMEGRTLHRHRLIVRPAVSAEDMTTLADALEWIARRNRVRFIIHYLDDFVLVGAP